MGGYSTNVNFFSTKNLKTKGFVSVVGWKNRKNYVKKDVLINFFYQFFLSKVAFDVLNLTPSIIVLDVFI